MIVIVQIFVIQACGLRLASQAPPLPAQPLLTQAPRLASWDRRQRSQTGRSRTARDCQFAPHRGAGRHGVRLRAVQAQGLHLIRAALRMCEVKVSLGAKIRWRASYPLFPANHHSIAILRHAFGDAPNEGIPSDSRANRLETCCRMFINLQIVVSTGNQWRDEESPARPKISWIWSPCYLGGQVLVWPLSATGCCMPLRHVPCLLHSQLSKSARWLRRPFGKASPREASIYCR